MIYIKMKNCLLTLFVLCISANSSAQSDWTRVRLTGPGGVQTTCHDLEAFGSPQVGSDSNLFGMDQVQWTPEMISFLVGMAYDCQTHLIQDMSKQKKLTPQLTGLIHDHTERTAAKLHAVMDQNDALAKSAAASDRAQAQSDREAKKQLAENARRLLVSCEDTKEYRFYDAEDAVMQDIDVLQGWDDNARQERRVSNFGGVRNLSNEYINAQGKVSAQDALKQAWADYKSLGGRAASPQKVRHRSADPCLALRSPENPQLP